MVLKKNQKRSQLKKVNKLEGRTGEIMQNAVQRNEMKNIQDPLSKHEA